MGSHKGQDPRQERKTPAEMEAADPQGHDQHQPVSAFDLGGIFSLLAQYAPIVLEFLRRLRERDTNEGTVSASAPTQQRLTPQIEQKLAELVDCCR